MFLLVLKGRADGTVKSYSASFHRFMKWTEKRAAEALPATPIIAAAYLREVTSTARTPATAVMAATAISWAHRMAELPDPFDSPIAKAMVEAARRTLPSNMARKEPITTADIKRIAEQHTAKTEANARLMALLLLGYSAFLRFSELAELRISDITIKGNEMTVSVRKAKNDQHRQGNERLVQRGAHQETCPIAAVEAYLAFRADSNPEGLFFHAIRSAAKLSYTRGRELIREAVSEAGLDPAKFGTHSLRSGGATAAANAGVPSEAIQLHGNWRSEVSKNRYILRAKKTRLAVSNNLGL